MERHDFDVLIPRLARVLSRRSAFAALAGSIAGAFRPASAATCAPRGKACSIMQPCCGKMRCRWLDHNPFVGVCSGGRSTPPGVPIGTNARWSMPRGTVTCDDFTSQRDARHFLRRVDDRFFARLDTNGNGLVCDSLPRK